MTLTTDEAISLTQHAYLDRDSREAIIETIRSQSNTISRLKDALKAAGLREEHIEAIALDQPLMANPNLCGHHSPTGAHSYTCTRMAGHLGVHYYQRTAKK